MKLKHLLLAGGLVASCQSPSQDTKTETRRSYKDDIVSVLDTPERGSAFLQPLNDDQAEKSDLSFFDIQDSLEVRKDSLLRSTSNKVFVTLDDGPNQYTSQILKMLDSL